MKKRKMEDTSLEAYFDKIKPNAENLREIVFSVIEAHTGLSCFQIEKMTGMTRSTVSSRITELKQAGRIRATGERRPTPSGCTANVYVVNDLSNRLSA